ncbi:hypothetical protein SB00610_03305 [Klebsiella quasipneumoniae subsp. similipneumoniae]|nr:hypothetical protein SB00610_03305 [Klebsiella quasipneumoniae subsp. similipneumoniae]
MEEAFFTKDFFQFRPENREGDAGNRRDETHRTHPFGVADDVLVEEAVNGVHKEHEGKGQHKEHAENNQRAVMSELVEKVGGFDVGGLLGGRDNAFFGEFITDKQGHRADDHIDGVHAEPGVVRRRIGIVAQIQLKAEKAGVFQATIFRRRHLHKHREQGIDQQVGAVGQHHAGTGQLIDRFRVAGQRGIQRAIGNID